MPNLSKVRATRLKLVLPKDLGFGLDDTLAIVCTNNVPPNLYYLCELYYYEQSWFSAIFT